MTAPRRIAIVRALLEAEGRVVSGEALAADLGMSRVAVGKHIAVLRDLGFSIASVRRAGYRLESAPAVTLPETVAPLVRDPLWSRFAGGRVVASTNDDAKRLATDGAAEGTVVVAASQSGGRGRLGRGWESPEGGAYFSAVLRPGLAPVDISPLALVIAVGVVRGLTACGVDAQVKWPNDVLLGGRKLVGLLLEMSAEADKVEWVVAGVGINVRRGADAVSGFGCVEDVAPHVGPAAVAAAVLDAIAVAYRLFIAEGFASFADEYASLDALRGSDVVVRDAMGAVVASGVAGGVDDAGRLLVGTTVVSAGAVTLRDEKGGEA